ncbi:MAG: AgmX/PglI C-terminal domain-containing protein [Archangium sp.]|nr:AgmX/PglI C-terminal domain-containing protein [Archangium sp.]
MELRTEGVPTRRVLGADDGAPLDGDRVLAVALRWADRPLSVDHVKVGEARIPLDGVEIRWEGNLPIVATAAGARAWVERSPGNWVDPGRRTALELGETLIVQSGELTLEARIQRRSEKAPAVRKQEGLFFGLVMTHSLMLFVAVTVAMVITPRTDEESMWGAPSSLLKRIVTPFTSLPERKKPVLEERINDVVKTANHQPITQPKTKPTAMDAIRLLMGGGGGMAGFLARSSDGMDSAINKLHGPASANEGMGNNTGRDIGARMGPGSLGIGPLGPGRGPGPNGLPSGLRGHHIESVICKDCLPTLPPGYDRDLVLKVVRRHQNEIRFCYESELAQAPDLSGKVTVAWTIGASGSVESAQIAESGLSNERVEACIVQRVKRWTFPEPQGGQEVAITFPWVFQVAGSSPD